MTRGVPAGYQHKWKYKGHWNETKDKTGHWKVNFTALKTRKGSSKGGLPVGSTIIWDIKGKQYATKVSGRTYKTRLVADKHARRVVVKKRKHKRKE